MCKNKGFTLTEMLIVVAAIAILIVIAIPVFSAHLEKTRKATCDANLASCVHLLYAQEMADGGVLTTTDGGTMETALKLGMDAIKQTDGRYKKETDKPLCPDQGEYTFLYLPENHAILYACSVHGSGVAAPELVGHDLKGYTGLATLVFDGVNANRNTITKYFAHDGANAQLDSTGGNFGKFLKKKLLEALNMSPQDAANFDFSIARAKDIDGNTDTGYYIYLCPSLSSAKPGDIVTATKYYLGSGNHGTIDPRGTEELKVERDKSSGSYIKRLDLFPRP